MVHPDCIVVLYAFNQESLIAQIVQEWLAETRVYLDDSFRLIIIDDGSSDRTGEILDTLALSHPEISVIHQTHRGQGKAILEGYRLAASFDPKYIVRADSFLAMAPSAFGTLWMGRRYAKSILGFHPGKSLSSTAALFSKVLSALVKTIFGLHIPEPDTRLRLFEGKFLSGLLEKIPSQALFPDTLLAVLACRLNQTLMVPILWEGPKAVRRSRARFLGLLASISELLAFRFSLGRTLRHLQTKSLPISPEISHDGALF